MTPDAPPRTETQPDTHAAAAALVTKKPVAAAPAPRVEAKKSAAPIGKTPAGESMRPPAAAASAPTVDATAKGDVQAPAPVTLTGCLEGDEKTFWLKDTAGVDALKSRSWKSGFLKKRSPQIALIDSVNTLHLPTYVGQRIAATGTVTNREMRVSSLHRVSASCN